MQTEIKSPLNLTLGETETVQLLRLTPLEIEALKPIGYTKEQLSGAKYPNFKTDDGKYIWLPDLDALGIPPEAVDVNGRQVIEFSLNWFELLRFQHNQKVLTNSTSIKYVEDTFKIFIGVAHQFTKQRMESLSKAKLVATNVATIVQPNVNGSPNIYVEPNAKLLRYAETGDSQRINFTYYLVTKEQFERLERQNDPQANFFVGYVIPADIKVEAELVKLGTYWMPRSFINSFEPILGKDHRDFFLLKSSQVFEWLTKVVALNDVNADIRDINPAVLNDVFNSAINHYGYLTMSFGEHQTLLVYTANRRGGIDTVFPKRLKGGEFKGLLNITPTDAFIRGWMPQFVSSENEALLNQRLQEKQDSIEQLVSVTQRLSKKMISFYVEDNTRFYNRLVDENHPVPRSDKDLDKLYGRISKYWSEIIKDKHISLGHTAFLKEDIVSEITRLYELFCVELFNRVLLTNDQINFLQKSRDYMISLATEKVVTTETKEEK